MSTEPILSRSCRAGAGGYGYGHDVLPACGEVSSYVARRGRRRRLFSSREPSGTQGTGEGARAGAGGGHIDVDCRLVTLRFPSRLMTYFVPFYPPSRVVPGSAVQHFCLPFTSGRARRKVYFWGSLGLQIYALHADWGSNRLCW